MAAIIEHHYWEIQTKRLNEYFKHIIFIVFYIATVGCQLVIYLTHNPNSDLSVRIIMSICALCLCFTPFSVSMMCTWISKAAHKPYAIIFSYISSLKTVISLRQRLVVMGYIERLSGPAISYYCYDLFPMNSYELYRYFYIAGTNYILIMTLL